MHLISKLSAELWYEIITSKIIFDVTLSFRNMIAYTTFDFISDIIDKMTFLWNLKNPLQPMYEIRYVDEWENITRSRNA